MQFSRPFSRKSLENTRSHGNRTFITPRDDESLGLCRAPKPPLQRAPNSRRVLPWTRTKLRPCNPPLRKIGRNFGRIYPTCTSPSPSSRIAILTRLVARNAVHRHYVSRVGEAVEGSPLSFLLSFSNGFSLKVFFFTFKKEEKRKERWKFCGLLDFRPLCLFLSLSLFLPRYFGSRSSGGFATQTPDTKTKSRSVEREKEGGEEEGGNGR